MQRHKNFRRSRENARKKKRFIEVIYDTARNIPIYLIGDIRQVPSNAIRPNNVFRVKDISFARLKIGVDSTSSSLYIFPSHSTGTHGTPDPLFPPEDLSSIPSRSASTLASLFLSTLLTLLREAIWIPSRCLRISAGISTTGQLPSTRKDRNRTGDARDNRKLIDSIPMRCYRLCLKDKRNGLPTLPPEAG